MLKPSLLVERDWEAVVAKRIAVFDAGAYHLTEVMTKLSFEVNTTTSLEERNRLWIHQAEKFEINGTRSQRKKKDKIKQIRMTKAEVGPSYSSGAF